MEMYTPNGEINLSVEYDTSTNETRRYTLQNLNTPKQVLPPKSANSDCALRIVNLSIFATAFNDTKLIITLKFVKSF